MKGASILFTILLFVLAGQIGTVLNRVGALPAQAHKESPRAVLVPVAYAPAHPQAPEASMDL